MAKQAYVYSGTEWVPLASEVTNLSAYQTKALNQYPYRNLVINGAMNVYQRGSSFTSVTTGPGWAADRFLINTDSFATWTISNENDAPTGSGFRRSVKYLVTTADASPSANDYASILHKIEGQNLQHIKKGTASAEQLTLSFWVKSNVTGTYSIMIYDNDNTRFTSFNYSISASGVWEYKTITIPADTTGPLDNDNIDSLQIYWNLGSGSAKTGGAAQTTWKSFTGSETQWMPSQVNVGATVNNYFQLTGVQLEVGNTATPFEFKPFAQDLAECQRYYVKSFPVTTAPADNQGGGVGSSNSATQNFFSVAQVSFPVEMRANPTITYFNPNAVTTNKIRDASGNNYPAYTQVGPTTKGFTVAVNNTSFAGGGTLGFTNYTAEIEL